MDEIEILNNFLSGALKKESKHRYRSLIQTKKGQIKFLKSLCHQFEDKINDLKVINELPIEVWKLSSLLFSERDGFGIVVNNFKTAFQKSEDSCLIVDYSGKFGIYKPESMVDDIKYIAL